MDLYDSNAEFNGYVNDAHERVSIFDEDFLPSRILFELAPEPYRLYLAEYKQENSIEFPSEMRIELPPEMQIELPGEG